MANRTDSITLDENRLEYEVKQMLIVFGQKETEETWESHENAIFKLTAIMRGSGHLTNMISALKRLKQGIQNAISTDRTRLSRAAMLLVEEIGRSLGSRFEALVDSFVPPVLKIATRANRVFVASSTQCLMVLVEHTGCTSIIPFLVESVKNPSKTLRIAAMDTLLKFMNTQSSDRYDNLVDLVEAAIRIGIVDSTPVVRETCRKIFEIYKEIFPYRVDGFVSPLNDITKKYLKITTRENSQPQRNGISSRPKTSKKPDAIDFPSAHNESTTHNLSRAKSQRSLREEYRKPRNPREVDMSFGSHDSYSQRDTSRTAQRPPQYDEASGISSNSGWLSSGKATQKAMRVPNSNPAPLSQNEVAAELFGALAKLSNPIRSVASMESLGGSSYILESGGAQRVPANQVQSDENSASSGVSMRKPLRVPAKVIPPQPPAQPEKKSLSSTSPGREDLSHVSYERRNEAKNRRKTTGVIPPGIQQSRSYENSLSMGPIGGNSRQSSVTSEPPLLELSEIIKMVKSTEWMVRIQGFEALGRFVAETSTDLRIRIPKITEIYAQGLQDSHFKVIHAIALSLQDAVPRIAQYYNHVDQQSCQSFLDYVVPLLAAAVFQPNTMRTKQNLFDAGMKTVEMFRFQFRGDPLLLSLLASFNNPEWAQNTRVRQGVIMFLADLQVEEWISFVARLSNVKNALVRLAAVSGDKLDVLTQRNLRGTIGTLHMGNSDNFWTVWAQLKPNDKANINKLFDVPDLYTNTKVLFEAVNTKVSAARSSSPSRPSSPTNKLSSRERSMSPALRAPQRSRPSNVTRSPLSRSALSNLSTKSSPLASPRNSISSASSSTQGNVWPTLNYAPSFGSTTSERPAFQNQSQNRTPTRMPAALTLINSDQTPKSNVKPVHASKSTISLIEKLQMHHTQSESDKDKISTSDPNYVYENDVTTTPSRLPISRRSRIMSISSSSSLVVSDGKADVDDEIEHAGDGWIRRKSFSPNSISGEHSPPIEFSERGRTLDRTPRGLPPPKVYEMDSAQISPNKANISLAESETTPKVGMEFTFKAEEEIESETVPAGFDTVSGDDARNSIITESGENAVVEETLKAEPVETSSTNLLTHTTTNGDKKQNNRQIYSWDERVLTEGPNKLKEMLMSADKENLGTLGSDAMFLKQSETDVVAKAAESSTVSEVEGISSDFYSTPREEFKHPIDTTEEVAAAVARSSTPATTLERILDVARRRRTSLWGTKSSDLVMAVIESLSDKNQKSAQSIQKSLILLRELIVNQHNSIDSHAVDILLTILRSQNFPGTTEEILEIAYEIDQILDAFVQYLTAESVRDAVLTALKSNIGHRVCFEMLSMLVETGVLDDLVQSDAFKELENPNTSDAPVIVWYIAKGLESDKPATRKAAFDCSVTLNSRLGQDFADLLLWIIKREAGPARRDLIQEMLRKRMEKSSETK